MYTPINLFLRAFTKKIDEPFDEKPFLKDTELLEAIRSKNNLLKNLDILSNQSKKIHEQSKLIFNNLEDGVMILNKNLEITDCNPPISKLLQIDLQKLKGMNLGEISSVGLIASCKELIEKSCKSGMISSMGYQLGNARKQYLELIVIPAMKKEGVIVLIRDYSSHVKMQEMGKDFIANASHELRTPITIIKGFGETLRDLPEISGAMLEDIMEKILRSCERMDLLVKNLLLLADLDYLPRARLIPCDPIGLVENAAEHILSVYPKANIEVEVQPNFQKKILADPDLFELSISNLLQNAVKYSKIPAQITVKIQEKEDKVFLKICDKGIGIPEKEIDHIFERFYTVDKAHSRKLGGAGLGLSIVKHIIDKHEGVISVDSEIEVGTTFTIRVKSAS